MLAVEERIIDTTTEEYKQAQKDYEESQKAEASAVSSDPPVVDKYGDPE